MITLHEDGAYESRVLTACELARQKDSRLVAVGAVSRMELFIVKVWKGFADLSIRFWKAVTKRVYKF